MSNLLSFDPDTRRIWMFPRNIRDIAPWKLYKILKVLLQCEDVNQYSGEEQQMMYRLLDESGIKKKGKTRDKNPGGMRTYYSQLETLGLVFRAESSKSYSYTIAGETIANEENPLSVLQYQLLRHQYPSAYGLGQNVKIDSRVRVKPFMFLLRLLHDQRLENYLTNFDVVFLVIYGHNIDCYEFVVSKILEFRSKDDFREVIDNWEIDLYTPRGSADKAINNMCDIANTAINYLKAAALIIVEGNNKGRTKYIFNANYETLYQQFLKEEDSFIPIRGKQDYESFQRAYGRYDKNKDNRSLSECTSQTKVSPALQFATFKYVEYLNDHLFEDDSILFVAEMASYGISSKDSIAAVERLSPRKISLQENTYLDYAFSGGTLSNEFEKSTTELLKSLGFSDSQWIGRRKSQKNWRGNFPDVYIKKPETMDCGLADAKASSSYSLGHADMLKMKDTYIHTNDEIEPGSHLVYFVYISGGYKGDINNSLSMLSRSTNIPVSAVDARGMLKLLDKHWTAEEIEERIFMSGEYISSDQIELM